MKISNEIAKLFDFPQEQKGEVKIQNKNEESLIKSNKTAINTQEISILKELRHGLPIELRQALAELYEKGMPIDKDTMQALKTFLDKFIGSPQQKIEVIKALLGKDIDMNLTNLKLVYEALYGEDMSRIIKDQGIDLKGEKSLEEARDISAIINQIRGFVLESISLDKIADWIEDALKSVDVDPKIERTLFKAANEARQAAAYRMDDIGMRILTKALNDISREVNREEIKAFEKIEEDYTKTELSSVALSGKDYIVVEVSKRLNVAKQSFKELKMQIARNIDMAMRYVKGQSTSNIANAKDTLEKTIEILDKAILKGDITLFTDMQTEKELIKVSSQLAKARELIDMGQHEKAEKLMGKVKDVFEKLNWKPDHTRIVHFSNMKQAIGESNSDRERLYAAVKNIEKPFIQGQASGRMLYEALRLLGADHEGEAARYLAGEDIPKDDINKNIKAILLNLLEKEKDVSQDRSGLSNMMDKITGQQLLSRSDKGEIQTMFLSLPLPMGGSLKDVRFYINSKKEKEKMDWKNCSIFFLIETKKLGETGVLLQSSGRNLTVTVKNDRKDIEGKVKSLLSDFKENLMELGYEVGNITFTKLDNKGEENIDSQPFPNKTGMKGINSMTKGFDARI